MSSLHEHNGSPLQSRRQSARKEIMILSQKTHSEAGWMTQQCHENDGYSTTGVTQLHGLRLLWRRDEAMGESSAQSALCVRDG
jgi:hypothetical protein